MGFRDLFRKKSEIIKITSEDLESVDKKQLFQESDQKIIKAGIERNEPCVLFIPYDDIYKSLQVVKPAGFKGYFIVGVPALFRDGSIRTLFKEEFTLSLAVNGHLSAINPKGRTYFFLGLHSGFQAIPENTWLDPTILYQQKSHLLDLKLSTPLERVVIDASPTLESYYAPQSQNLKVSEWGFVDYTLQGLLYPAEEREDPSMLFQKYEDWANAKYPTSGEELSRLFDKALKTLETSLGAIS